MKRAIIFVYGLIVACRVTTAGEGPKRDAGVGGPTSPDENVVHVDPDMLRDLQVVTAPAEVRTAGEGIHALGELHVDEDRYAEVGAPVPARAVKVHAQVGQMVRRGDALATLESPEVGRLRAALAVADARSLAAKQKVDETRLLAKERFVSRRELNEAERGRALADADVVAARSAVAAVAGGAGASHDVANARLAIRAPISGTVIERAVVRGEFVEPRKALFRLADMTELWLVLSVFERESARLHVGQAATVTFPALPGRTLTGTVSLIGREVDRKSRTVPVRVVVRNEGGQLIPGMSASARVAVEEGKGKIIAVPRAALERQGGGWIVFVPRGKGEFEARKVGRGRDLGNEVEILSGLRAAEHLVTQGAFLLRAELDKRHHRGDADDH